MLPRQRCFLIWAVWQFARLPVSTGRIGCCLAKLLYAQFHYRSRRILALADADPASPLLADAVRYLTAHRRANGGWFSSYDSAWVLMALTRYLHATSELKRQF